MIVVLTFDAYASAVGEKHTTAARRDMLYFFVRGVWLNKINKAK